MISEQQLLVTLELLGFEALATLPAIGERWARSCPAEGGVTAVKVAAVRDHYVVETWVPDEPKVLNTWLCEVVLPDSCWRCASSTTATSPSEILEIVQCLLDRR